MDDKAKENRTQGISEKEIYTASNFLRVFRTGKEQLKATAGQIYGIIEEDELIFARSLDWLQFPYSTWPRVPVTDTWTVRLGRSLGDCPVTKDLLHLLNAIIPCLSLCTRNSGRSPPPSWSSRRWPALLRSSVASQTLLLFNAAKLCQWGGSLWDISSSSQRSTWELKRSCTSTCSQPPWGSSLSDPLALRPFWRKGKRSRNFLGDFTSPLLADCIRSWDNDDGAGAEKWTLLSSNTFPISIIYDINFSFHTKRKFRIFKNIKYSQMIVHAITFAHTSGEEISQGLITCKWWFTEFQNSAHPTSPPQSCAFWGHFNSVLYLPVLNILSVHGSLETSCMRKLLLEGHRSCELILFLGMDILYSGGHLGEEQRKRVTAAGDTCPENREAMLS